LRKLEATLFALLLPLIFLGAMTPYPLLVAVMVLTAVAALLQVFIEKFRWQMIPAYALAVALLASAALHIGPCRALSFALVLAWLLGLFLAVAFPVFRLPKPGGPHPVGTRVRHFVSTSRKDPFKPDLPRQLMLQLWYPAESAACSVALYRQRASLTFRSARFALVRTSSFLNAPVSTTSGQLPLLIFVPSWRGYREECTALCQELASHGYLVIGVDHPGLTARVVFPDGQIQEAVDLPGEDYSSDESRDAFVRAAELQVAVRAADVGNLLDQIAQWVVNDPDGFFTRSVDMNRIGIFGYSIGGSTSCELCSTDPRIRAGVNLGGLVVGECLRTGPRVPFLFLFDDDPAISPATLNDPSSTRRRAAAFGVAQVSKMKNMLSRASGAWMRLPGTAHSDLSDVPFFSPFRILRRAGILPRKRLAGTICVAVHAFFEQHLNSGPGLPVQHLRSIFPGCEVQIFPGNADGSSDGAR
jgi:dienelactone hydrolase